MCISKIPFHTRKLYSFHLRPIWTLLRSFQWFIQDLMKYGNRHIGLQKYLKIKQNLEMKDSKYKIPHIF